MDNISADCEIPKYCFSCGSEDLKFRAVICSNGALQTKNICMNCGYTQNLRKEARIPRERKSTREQTWRKRALSRFFCCRICGSREKLQVHHIIPVSCEKKYEFTDSNAIVLCEECHKLVHKNDYYNRDRKPFF